MRKWAITLSLVLVACGDDGGGSGTETDASTSNGTSSSGPTSGSGSDTSGSSSSGAATDSGSTTASGTSTATGSTGGGGSTSGGGSSSTGSSSGGSAGSTGGTTGGASDCNFDDTCNGTETSSTCPADCPWSNQPSWCGLVQTGCGFYEQTPGTPHHEVCVDIVQGKYTSNPTNQVVERAYSIYLPSAYDGSADTPIYLWLHGSDVGADPKVIEDYATMLDTADAMASPDDTGAIWVAPVSDNPWNGTEWSFAYQVLETVSCIYNSDPERLYIGGYQAGGSAALRIGYDPQVGVPNIAAIAPWRPGNSINDIGGLLFDPCTQARLVPTFLSASTNADTAKANTESWNTYLEGCYPANRVTYQPFPGGVVPKWDPAHYGKVEWPWISAWKLSD